MAKLDEYTLWALITSVISTVVLIFTLVSWFQHTCLHNYKSKRVSRGMNNSQSTTNLPDADGNGSPKPRTRPNIPIPVRKSLNVTVLIFVFQSVVWTIILSIFAVPKYHTPEFRKGLFWFMPFRIVAMGSMYIFFWHRVTGVFRGTVHDIAQHPMYKKVFFGVFIWYCLIFFIIYIIIYFAIVAETLSLNSILLLLFVGLAASTEFFFSAFLLRLVVVRFNKIRQSNKEMKNESNNSRIQEVSNKLVILTAMATLSTFFSLIAYAIESLMVITDPPITQICIDGLFNTYCVVLSMNFYKREYEFCCYICRRIYPTDAEQNDGEEIEAAHNPQESEI